MSASIVIFGGYVAVAVGFAFALRGRWVRWYSGEFPNIATDGVAPSWFLYTCALWPVCVPLFLAESRKAARGGASRIERWMRRGA